MEVQIPQFKEEIAFISKLMREASEILLKNYEYPQGIEVKADKTLVTEVDKKVSTLIFSSLEKEFPEYGILDEEHGGKDLDRRKIWVSDPLDGTAEYIKKTGDFGIIIGLLENMQPIFGVTYKPQKDEFVYAAKECGAYLFQSGKTTKLRVSNSDDIHVLISRERSSEELEKMLNNLKPSSVKHVGGSLKTVEVAKGIASLFLCPRTSPMSIWDICAPSVILEEANGRITDVYGNRFNFQNLKDNKNYNGIIATNGRVHELVLERIYPVIK